MILCETATDAVAMDVGWARQLSMDITGALDATHQQAHPQPTNPAPSHADGSGATSLQLSHSVSVDAGVMCDAAAAVRDVELDGSGVGAQDGEMDESTHVEGVLGEGVRDGLWGAWCKTWIMIVACYYCHHYPIPRLGSCTRV